MLQQSRAWIASNLERHILHRARARARKTGLDFDLDLADIVIPDLCPELGIPLERLAGFASPGTPSIDRIDNSRGYVRGNVRIISFRANQDDSGYECRVSTRGERSSLLDSDASIRSIEVFREKEQDAFCDRSNVWWLKNEKGMTPSRDLHVRFASKRNEFALTTDCTSLDYDHVLNEIRTLNR